MVVGYPVDIFPDMMTGGGGGGNAGVSAQRPIMLGEEKCNELAKQLGYVRRDDEDLTDGSYSKRLPSNVSSTGCPPSNVPFVAGPHKSLAFDGNFDDMDKVKLVIKRPGRIGQKFLSISRGNRATPYRIFVTEHVDMKHIYEEVDMSYPEAVAKLDDDARRFWVQQLGKHARQFFKVVFSELWTWEFGEQHHLDMLNILDERQ